MACVNMFNNEQHQGLYNNNNNNTMGPRISFSNDFADSQQPSTKLENSYREAPVSSDFAFSVPNYSMISADEVFFKGKMVPSKDNNNCAKTTTLRDELLGGSDDDYDDVSSRLVAKGSCRWRERLGLKRSSHVVVAKKSDKSISDGSNLKSIDEMKISENAY
ncbi:hypothetical protein ABFS82_02G033800 [Erythranthe guttata]